MIIRAKQGQSGGVRASLEEWFEVGFVRYCPGEDEKSDFRAGHLLVADSLSTPVDECVRMELDAYTTLVLLNDRGEQMRFFK